MGDREASVVHVLDMWGNKAFCAALCIPRKRCLRDMLAGCARPYVLSRCLPSLVQPTLLALQHKAAE